MAALVDRSRRALYEYVRRAGHPVTREEAAAAQGMSRNLTAFHLDKLVESGLLCARYEAPADQPRGRGRTPKVYEPAGDGVAVTIPERRYELIAEILAAAIVEDTTDAGRTAHRHARQRGRDLGARARAEGGDLDGAVAALAALGFEPQTAPGRVLLANCPFHALADRHPALVCGLNHAFVAGLVEGSDLAGARARLDPQPGACCVRIEL